MDNIYDYTKVRKQIDGCVCGGVNNIFWDPKSSYWNSGILLIDIKNGSKLEFVL